MPTPPDMPPQPQTTELPAVKVPKSQLDAVLEEIRAARAEGQETHEAVGALAANVEVLTQHVDTLTSRVTLVERRQDDAEGRARNHSGGLARVSENDAAHAAAIGQLFVDVAELKTSHAELAKAAEEQTKMLRAVKAEVVDGVKGFFAKHPQVTASLVTLIVTAIGAATAWIAAKGH